MKTNDEEKQKDNVVNSHNRFYRLPCRILRKYVFHGVKDVGDVQTITCLSCGDKYSFHIDGRNRIEKSLWDLYEKHGASMDIKPKPERRPKKRWSRKILFFRG